MNEQFRNQINNQFEQLVGIPIQDLVSPISESSPCGQDLRSNGVYQKINDARKADDPSLPRGVWTHDLKKSEWDIVKETAIDALSNKTKDLQIGFWLLESQIHQNGLHGVAPCLALLIELCDNHWKELHPQIIDDDLEYRTNSISWANRKLLPALRLAPITDNPKLDEQYSWADWELAAQREQIQDPNNNGNRRKKTEEETTTDLVLQSISLTSTNFYEQLYQSLENAIIICEEFEVLLEKLCDGESPGFHDFCNLMKEIYGIIASILEQRGANLQQLSDQYLAPVGDSNGDSFNAESDEDGANNNGGNGHNGGGSGGPIQSRSQAYQQLAEAAEFLVHIEPHSPVPYLVRRAIQWGNLSTAELYQELFVDFQGQLNIFEILGLEIQK
ncbi:type VI secretion system protein TssA [Aliikangiella coralliicola]|uniref:Type VI secretion system protein TssA n=1 Tax=Aliikangiella coralliicola TaxID=2592383 RepID=A0A545UCR3_9GAMM|nr:type VI secretion system protein TssA [Aliikangiella coralliicola]TQV87258.1 type VI secretion system protein TssA [Aliikangiella coralliicola]